MLSFNANSRRYTTHHKLLALINLMLSLANSFLLEMAIAKDH